MNKWSSEIAFQETIHTVQFYIIYTSECLRLEEINENCGKMMHKGKTDRGSLCFKRHPTVFIISYMKYHLWITIWAICSCLKHPTSHIIKCLLHESSLHIYSKKYPIFTTYIFSPSECPRDMAVTHSFHLLLRSYIYQLFPVPPIPCPTLCVHRSFVVDTSGTGTGCL